MSISLVGTNNWDRLVGRIQNVDAIVWCQSKKTAQLGSDIFLVDLLEHIPFIDVNVA